jgi:hypothetical protein
MRCQDQQQQQQDGEGGIGLCAALDWLFDQWWQVGGVTPTSWNRSYVVPLYKGKGGTHGGG